MSGLAPNWAADDAASFGEGVARCQRPGCNSPMELACGDTIIFVRCQHARHVKEIHLVYAEGWHGEP
jgi:hypothetical protein